MADDDFQDIHDALGILPTDQLAPPSPLLQQLRGTQLNPAAKTVGNALLDTLGISDAMKALRGEMTEEEAKGFALGALPGLIPGARGEAAAAEDIPALIKGVYTSAWKEGKPPFSTVSDIMKKSGPDQFVHNYLSGGELGQLDKELEAKYGDWSQINFAKANNPGLSDEEIHNYLTKNPGGNIFDLTGHGQTAFDDAMQADAEAKEFNLPRKAADYNEHIQPIEDWQEQRARDDEGHGPSTFDFDTVEQRERARNQGYNVDMPLYKGGAWNEYQESLLDPNRKSGERALFFADNKDVAQKYTHFGSEPLQYVARANKPMEVDWQDATGLDTYNGEHMHNIIESARQKGADMLIVKDMWDMGGKQHQYVVLDPKIVRQPGAEFDPSKMNLAKLAAGIGGAGVVGKNVLQGGDQQ